MYRRRKVNVEEKPPIPDNLEDFGYVLKENGEVRSITQGSCLVVWANKYESLTHFLNTDLPYEFDYLPKDRPYNEERYDKFISKKPKE